MNDAPASDRAPWRSEGRTQQQNIHIADRMDLLGTEFHLLASSTMKASEAAQ
jgi:hypothetical protein